MPAGLTTLAKALPDMSTDAECLHPPRNLPYELPAPLRQPVFMRKCYRRALDRIVLPADGDQSGATVITGTPGNATMHLHATCACLHLVPAQGAQFTRSTCFTMQA